MLVPSNQNQGGCCGTAESCSKMLKGQTKCKNTSNVVYSELTCQLFALTMHYDFCRDPNRYIPRSPSIAGGHQIEMGSKAAESNKNGKPGLEAVDASRRANTHITSAILGCKLKFWAPPKACQIREPLIPHSPCTGKLPLSCPMGTPSRISHSALRKSTAQNVSVFESVSVRPFMHYGQILHQRRSDLVQSNV